MYLETKSQKVLKSNFWMAPTFALHDVSHSMGFYVKPLS